MITSTNIAHKDIDSDALLNGQRCAVMEVV